MTAPVLALYRRLTRWPAGRWLFSRVVCFKAPYFATIAPRFLSLESGRCEVVMRDRRSVHNHIGTVHAIALCNLAEISGGVMTDVSIPASMRWIPKGMTVEYVKRAVGTMRAVAIPDIAVVASDQGYDLPVSVAVDDPLGDVVFRARITMWVSPREKRAA